MASRDRRPTVSSVTSWFDGRVAASLLALLVAGCDETDAGSDTDGNETASTEGDGGTQGTDGAEDGEDGDTEAPGTEDGDDDSDGDDGAPVSCDSPLTACGPDCVDLTSDADNCGACGVACVVPNGDATCDAGVCGLEVCGDGWANCDGTVTNGCETENTCESGGACATECGSTGALDCGDPCAPSCALPAESCNFADDDCDGECDEGGVEGCRIGVHRTDDPTYGQILMTDAADAATYDVDIEQMNWIYLYVLPGAGSQPLQRCINGTQLGYSEENGCGMFGGYESTLGFFGVEPLCGGVLLTRLVFPSNNGTRLAIDQAEIDTYVAQGWTVDPSFVAYAWLEP